ncbi:MAG: hypothetical protein JWN43_4342 [Gammaproteobacteria bacterium]|nr:hypothetical protein [Gammaproteobacteria bacterium]
MDAELRAFFGYVFLVLVVRVVGRRPGKQLTPFEFVLVFFIGGLTLTAIVGDERSLTNAIFQILAIALAHFVISWARAKSSRLARLVDGTPLMLLERGRWRSTTMAKMRIQDEDVMAAARDHGIRSLGDIDLAILERDGDIGIIPRRGDTTEQ